MSDKMLVEFKAFKNLVEKYDKLLSIRGYTTRTASLTAHIIETVEAHKEFFVEENKGKEA